MYYTDTLRATRLLIGSMMGALVMLAVVLLVTLEGETLLAVPPLPWLVGVLIAGAVTLAVLELMGLAVVRPLTPGLSRADAAAASVMFFRTATIVRFAIAEMVALASFAGAFIVEEGGFVLYLVGMSVSLALLMLEAWPSRRTVRRTQEVLEREGARSHLMELYGFEPWTGRDTDKPSAVTRG
ncbi:hypothetical protein [Nocardioides sp.]|uniref:hypothetical protein n=1 Tax=Nocardioides sp. TaxID=35761 RepID=UPI0027350A3D|nr:hypothetical protein [Nocardioides sp.]MDP3894088.1 hypothetical protein [Nocardioides sp.]